jgi:hypothetical protein
MESSPVEQREARAGEPRLRDDMKDSIHRKKQRPIRKLVVSLLHFSLDSLKSSPKAGAKHAGEHAHPRVSWPAPPPATSLTLIHFRL